MQTVKALLAEAELLKKLVSGEFPKMAESRAFDATGESEPNPVDCTVFAPDRVEPKQSGLLQVFLHAPEDRKQVEATAAKFDRETKERGYRSLLVDAMIGSITGLAFVPTPHSIGRKSSNVHKACGRLACTALSTC